MSRCIGDDFLDARGEFHAHATGVAVNAAAHVGKQFIPFCDPQGAGFAAILAKRDNADDAVNAAIPGIVRVCAVVDVVFGGDGSVRLGDVFYGFGVVVQDANAAVLIASIGFKYGNVVRVGFNGVALNENERVCLPSPVLGVYGAETFVGHGICLALGSSTV